MLSAQQMKSKVKRMQHMNKNLKYVFVAIGCALLASCMSSNTKTLGSLKYEEDKEKEIEFEKLSHEEVRQEYKELIDLFEDKKLKEQIERRIADVYMMEAVDEEEVEKSEYVEAIKAYRNILERYPNSPDNAEVFYQLAKAYDLEGKQKEAMKMLTELVNRHPNYPNIAEAHFRKADIHFNWQQYKQAQTSYLAVTQLTTGRLKRNAHYMLGWVYYKHQDFESSINSFAYVMTTILSNGVTFDTLEKSDKPIIEDSIHSIALGLDKLGGAEAIPEMVSIANLPYVWRFYDHLGDYYLEKELYEQSAETFRHFVRKYENSERAPGMHKKLIRAYTDGKFPRQALAEKANYVASYGINSSFPGNVDGVIRADVKKELLVYIEELARFYYTEGQAFVDIIKRENKVNKNNPDKNKLKENDSKAIASFTKSADYYGEFIQTFPDNKNIDEIRFLKAEAHFLARNFLAAAKDYELVAYSPVGSSAKDKAADSGYAAIISYQKHIDKLNAGKKRDKKKAVEFQAVAVESMLKFAKKFDADKRSPTVLTNAAEYLFGLNQYDRAIGVANDLIASKNLDDTLEKTAYGILAHSYFKLEKYAEAKDAYIKQRGLTKKGGQEYNSITERIAAAVFKNAEAIEKASGKLASAEELLSLKKLAPNSPIRITAQYDAATLFMAEKQWIKALAEFNQLLALYPNHKLAVEFPRKIAFAYEKSEQWTKAADAYLNLYKNDPDANIQREALFNAAMMFEKIEDYESALTYFKRYAYDYEDPFNTRMEARYHMALNYERVGEMGKHLYWLRRIIDGDKKGGDQRTERSRYLAAWANAKYGDSFASEFRKRRLYQPLQKSLPKKQELLQNALKRYEMAAEYGIFEFVTLSSYKIGTLYEDFASHLRKAPKPKGLSASDQELYVEIIEEQAGPFDDTAISVYQSNIDRAWDGEFNEWIDLSFTAMKRLYPERFAKEEMLSSYGEGIH